MSQSFLITLLFSIGGVRIDQASYQSVVPSTGQKVYGMLWQVASGELEVLDQIEDPHAYQRHLTTVYGLDGRTWPSCMYTAIPQGTFAPDEEYLLLIIEAARIADFPEAYVESLRTTVWG